MSTPYDTDDVQRVAEYVTQCARCGCREFCVVETVEWHGEIGERGFLDCTSTRSSVESICCAECGEPHTPQCFANFDLD